MSFNLKEKFSSFSLPKFSPMKSKQEKLAEKHKPEYSFAYDEFKEKPRVEYMINWCHVYPEYGNTVWCGDESMFRVFKFRGADMGSATKMELITYTGRLNNAIKMLGSGYVVYLDAQRHLSTRYDHSDMPHPVLQLMEDERQAYYESTAHYESDYYLVIYHTPPVVEAEKLKSYFIEEDQNDKEAGHDSILAKTLSDFVKQTNLFAEILEKNCFKEMRSLNPEETISYLHNIVSDHRQVVKENRDKYINDYICDSTLIGGRYPKLGNKHMRVISLMSFPSFTTPGVFNDFNALNFEYRFVSRWICMDKNQADEEIKNCQKLWGQQSLPLSTIIKNAITQTNASNADVDEHAIRNSNDAAAARVELNEDYVSFGFYTPTLLVFDEDKRRCEKKASEVVEKLITKGYTGHLETENSLEAWRGTLPGCYRCNVRRPKVSSLNFCHLAPTTALWSGDKRNDALQGPVLLYTDSSGYTPFRLSLHVGDVGHTMIVGPSGAGKSVLLNTIEAHFTKYPKSNVFIFDKSASSRALTMAVNGNFYNLASEGSNELSFQPLANIEDDKERNWAKEWLLSYITSRGLQRTSQLENAIGDGLASLMEMPKNLRTITEFLVHVQDVDIRQSLISLTKDNSGTSYGKLFDNDRDFSGSGRWQVFEMETLMSTPAIMPITLDYLFHRIEGQISHAVGPSIIVLDECWLFFDNPVFRNKLREYFKDMRKKNTSIIFATQNLADIASKPDLFSVVLENCKSRIFLPNANAITEQSSDMYEKFGCNETQIQIISQLTPKQDYYYSSDRGNRVFSLALQPAELPFVTATAKSDQIKINQILADGRKEQFVHDWLMYKGFPAEWDKLVERMHAHHTH